MDDNTPPRVPNALSQLHGLMMLKLNDDQKPSSSKHFAPSLAETDECSERQMEEGCMAGSSDETEYVVDPPQHRVNDPIALREYIKSLNNEDIVKLLSPVKAGLLSE